MGLFGESIGWVVGSEAHFKNTRDANRPKMKPHESAIDHAKATLNYDESFSNSYWPRAYLKRAIIVIFILMLFTAPDFDTFKAYAKSKFGFSEESCHEGFNAVLLKKYSANGHGFIGAFGTFFELNFNETPIVRNVTKQDSVYKDPAKKRDTFMRFMPLPLPASVDTNAGREFDPPLNPPPQQQQKPPDTTHF